MQEPELHRDLISLDFVKNMQGHGQGRELLDHAHHARLPAEGPDPAESEKAIRTLIPDAGRVQIAFDARVRADKRIQEKMNLAIKTIIAVGSGKGGVGKSTVAAELRSSCLNCMDSRSKDSLPSAVESRLPHPPLPKGWLPAQTIATSQERASLTAAPPLLSLANSTRMPSPRRFLMPSSGETQ